LHASFGDQHPEILNTSLPVTVTVPQSGAVGCNATHCTMIRLLLHGAGAQGGHEWRLLKLELMTRISVHSGTRTGAVLGERWGPRFQSEVRLSFRGPPNKISVECN